MSFGTLYSYIGNTRTTVLLAIAKENNLDIALIETNPHKGVPASYLKLNPLGKIPTFVGSGDFVLSEVTAIAVYFASQNPRTTLLGSNKQDNANILHWMSFANSEVLPPLAGWFAPLIGRAPYVKSQVAKSRAQTLKAVQVLENHLLKKTFLVGERVTLADLFAASIIGRAFRHVLDKRWRDQHPNVTRWFETVHNVPYYAAVAG
ncbi:hypothetical protein E8E11_004717 [Didymella keratinophila]|nr:hypothetical protein E8E11_004717 [Didymella keratinophila]